MYSVILCGGSGTRLWPLSRGNYAKQFLKLYSDHSLLQETYLRTRKVMPASRIFFVGNKDSQFNILNQIRELEPGFSDDRIIVEPTSLNTAPAITYAVRALAEQHGASEKDPIIFIPADHHIADEEQFAECVKDALENVGDRIGTIGITPTSPHTGYGYIKKGDRQGDHFISRGFTEKPDKATAEKYIASGEYLWNSGMYVFNAKTFSQEIHQHAPDIADILDIPAEKSVEYFKMLPSVSIDYALAEKSDKIVVFEGDFGWNDIGSFDSLAETVKNHAAHKDHSSGGQISINSKNIFAHSDTGRLVATVGVEDLVIVDSNDSILIHKRGAGEDVKKVVEHLKANNMKEANHTNIEHRPWGTFVVLMDTPTYKTKRLTVYPGAKLSLQSHNHRSEHWVVVTGTATLINGDDEITLNRGESTYIPQGNKHRLMNLSDSNIEVIEVQTGDYFGEDDIIRYEDVYDRA